VSVIARFVRSIASFGPADKVWSPDVLKSWQRSPCLIVFVARLVGMARVIVGDRDLTCRRHHSMIWGRQQRLRLVHVSVLPI
jgi:hypothetical protein